MIGKISRLPAAIREQVNQRFNDAQPYNAILKWLNGLPEVKLLLKSEFEAKPISKQNLYDYRKYAFAHWKMRQSALQFATAAKAEQSEGSLAATDPLIDYLQQWILRRFSAVAQCSAISENPEIEFARTRKFLADIVSLRRGQLVSRRISIEQQRLDTLKATSQEEFERRFWEWTKRPDIQSKLYPHRDPDKVRRDVVRMLDRELLGIKHSPDDDPEPEPLAYI